MDSPISYHMATDFEFSQEVKDDFYCPVCKEILFKPVETLCEHYFCGECFKQALQHSGFSLDCPVCRTELSSADHIKKPARMVLRLTAELTVRCKNCYCELSYEDHKTICVLVKLILQSPTLPLTQQLTPLQPLWSKQWNSFARERFPPKWSAWLLCS